MKRSQLVHRLQSLVRQGIKEGEMPSQEIQALVDDIFEYRKVWTACGRVLEGSNKYFAAHPTTRDGFQSYCRDCGSQKRAKREEATVPESLDYAEDSKELDHFEELSELDYREPKKYA